MSRTDFDLSRIKAFAFDVDGVLSPDTIPLHPSGEPMRIVNIKDGYALQFAAKMGDDIPDYEVMQIAGLPACPADAAPEIKQIARYISPFGGGQGCGRDIIEQILRAQGKWMSDKTAFGW